MEKDFDNYNLLPEHQISVRGKRKINRICREIFGGSHIPHPEVDNLYERIRSKIVRKINQIKHKLNFDK